MSVESFLGSSCLFPQAQGHGDSWVNRNCPEQEPALTSPSHLGPPQAREVRADPTTSHSHLIPSPLQMTAWLQLAPRLWGRQDFFTGLCLKSSRHLGIYLPSKRPTSLSTVCHPLTYITHLGISSPPTSNSYQVALWFGNLCISKETRGQVLAMESALPTEAKAYFSKLMPFGRQGISGNWGLNIE